MVLVRTPAVAGSFYPRFKNSLRDLIRECFTDKDFGPGSDFKPPSPVKIKGSERNILGGVNPHAGYVYSGAAAAHTVNAVLSEGIPDTVIVMGTTHTGYGQTALMKHGIWETPLGKIKVDKELAKMIIEGNEVIEDDSAFVGFPHGREHNIEVQLPFIQYCAEKADTEIEFVPIKIGDMNIKKLEKIAKSIASAISEARNEGKDIAVFASSDMTHYQTNNPYQATDEIEKIQYERDRAVIESFKKFNIEETFKNARNTTVCGPQTITTLLFIGKYLDYNKTKALKYYTSFDKMGRQLPCDYSVGYFSGIITK